MSDNSAIEWTDSTWNPVTGCDKVSPLSDLKPSRLQRKRTAGWRMPENTVYVGRPSIYGNPWRVGELRGQLPPLTAEQAVRRYAQWLTATVSQPPHGVRRTQILRNLHQLRGRNLACWCSLDQPCHVDVLLELANSTAADHAVSLSTTSEGEVSR